MKWKKPGRDGGDWGPKLAVENQAIKVKLETLEKRQTESEDQVWKEIIQDRKRITALERSEPQPLQKDRGEILRAPYSCQRGKDAGD
jgi:hypothetical protein